MESLSGTAAAIAAFSVATGAVGGLIYTHPAKAPQPLAPEPVIASPSMPEPQALTRAASSADSLEDDRRVIQAITDARQSLRDTVQRAEALLAADGRPAAPVTASLPPIAPPSQPAVTPPARVVPAPQPVVASRPAITAAARTRRQHSLAYLRDRHRMIQEAAQRADFDALDKLARPDWDDYVESRVRQETGFDPEGARWDALKKGQAQLHLVLVPGSGSFPAIAVDIRTRRDIIVSPVTLLCY